MKYKKPVIVAVNNKNGSFAAGCPTSVSCASTGSCSSAQKCRSCAVDR